jgi:uncharacterized lipoprotein YmbA
MNDVNPNRTATAITRIALVTAGLLAASCGSLTQPSPEKASFAIDPGNPPPTMGSRQTSTAPAMGNVLRVRRLKVASPYNNMGFVYRSGHGEFHTDYYNGFIAAPDQLLTGALVKWLAQAGPFDSVVDTASGVDARYVLEGHVTALYGDYTDKAAPKAVIAMRVFLFDDSAANLSIVFQKVYEATSPIAAGNAASLVKGWDDAYRRILEQIAIDLRDNRSVAGKWSVLVPPFAVPSLR